MASPRRRSLVAGAALTAVAAFLLLWRLDVPLLWQDEAETANVAETVLLHGYPGPWDGEHLVTQQAGRDAVRIGDRLLWAWHPWLQHYLAAAGLALLGHGTAAARLPFALVALLSVPLFLAWRLRRDRPATAAVATAIYALAPTFVLFSRQCRYYPLLFLGGVLALRAYEALPASGDPRVERPEVGRRRQIGREAALAGSLGLLFYANPLSGLAFAAGLGLHGLLPRRRREAGLAPLVRSLALFALLAAPWLALVAVSDVRPPALGIGERLGLLVSQLWRLQYTLLPALLWPALAWLGWRARRSRPPGAEAGSRSVAAQIELLAILAAVSWLAVVAQGPLGTARYALALWPLAAAVLAALWRALQERSVAAGTVFLALVLLTNAFQALPAFPLAVARRDDPVTVTYDREAAPLDKLAYNGRITAPLPLHLASLARRECGPVAAAVAVGRSLRRPPRLVVAAYGYESLHFYLGAPAAGPGARAGRDHLDLPPLDLAVADLLVPRRGWPPGAIERVLDGAVEEAFTPVDTGVPDHAYENLPDPTGHRFAPAPPGLLPPLVVHVRDGLLPEEGLGETQAPGCAQISIPPAASTRTRGVTGTTYRSIIPVKR